VRYRRQLGEARRGQRGYDGSQDDVAASCKAMARQMSRAKCKAARQGLILLIMDSGFGDWRKYEGS
jgi:hypothetical protein